MTEFTNTLGSMFGMVSSVFTRVLILFDLTRDASCARAAHRPGHGAGYQTYEPREHGHGGRHAQEYCHRLSPPFSCPDRRWSVTPAIGRYPLAEVEPSLKVEFLL
jgi:hypothetical protein